MGNTFQKCPVCPPGKECPVCSPCPPAAPCPPPPCTQELLDAYRTYVLWHLQARKYDLSQALTPIQIGLLRSQMETLMRLDSETYDQGITKYNQFLASKGVDLKQGQSMPIQAFYPLFDDMSIQLRRFSKQPESSTGALVSDGTKNAGLILLVLLLVVAGGVFVFMRK